MTTTNVGRALILAAPPQDKFALCLEERLSFLFDLFIHDRDMICPLVVNFVMASKENVRSEGPFQRPYNGI